VFRNWIMLQTPRFGSHASGHRSITGQERTPMRQRYGCSAVSAEMVEHVGARKVGEAAQSVIILALKEEVADQVHLIGAMSEGPRADVLPVGETVSPARDRHSERRSRPKVTVSTLFAAPSRPPRQTIGSSSRSTGSCRFPPSRSAER